VVEVDLSSLDLAAQPYRQSYRSVLAEEEVALSVAADTGLALANRRCAEIPDAIANGASALFLWIVNDHAECERLAGIGEYAV
jgi:hypothetical protein